MESQNLSAVRRIRKKTVHLYISFGKSSNYNKYDTDRVRIIEFIHFILTVLVTSGVLLQKIFIEKTPAMTVNNKLSV